MVNIYGNDDDDDDIAEECCANMIYDDLSATELVLKISSTFDKMIRALMIIMICDTKYRFSAHFWHDFWLVFELICVNVIFRMVSIIQFAHNI